MATLTGLQGANFADAAYKGTMYVEGYERVDLVSNPFITRSQAPAWECIALVCIPNEDVGNERKLTGGVLMKWGQAELKCRNGDGYRVEHGMTKQARYKGKHI